jgi:hypothetical protein
MNTYTLVSGSHEVTIAPKKVTLRTHAEMSEWKAKISQHAAQNSTRNIELVLTLMKQVPELGALITPTGDFNAQAVHNIASNYKDISTEEATELAKAEIQKKILSIASDSPDVARALFFPDVTIASDAASIALCIDCIRATFDVSGVSKADLKLLMSPSTSDFWMDCAWEGVVAYAEGFCKLLK